MSARNRLRPVFVEQLFADISEMHIHEFRKSIEEGISARGFTPLIPPAMSKHLIKNSFGEITSEYLLFDVSNFMELLGAQYAVSPSGLGDNCARWASINAVLALVIRSKAAPGAGKGLSDIIHAFYRNAFAVLLDLILQDPSLLSIQALLAMAMFAQGTPDHQEFIMLVTSASRQLEMLNLSQPTLWLELDSEEMEQCRQVFRIAHILDKKVGMRYGIRSILDGSASDSEPTTTKRSWYNESTIG